MKWDREAVRDFAHAYFDIVSWAVMAAKRDGEIPYWDIESAFSHRTEVLEHFDLIDNEAKEYLKKADEIVLNNVDIFVESGDTHYPPKPSLFWHEYLDWVKEGRLKVEWDDELGVYVGRLVKR